MHNMKILRAGACTTTHAKSSKWRCAPHNVLSFCFLVLPVQAMAFTLQFGDEDFIQTPIAGDVQSFRFTVDIDAALEPGTYQNPPLVQIDYRVGGEPIAGSPSGFPAFALERSISGADFYQAGNELTFEIADTAVLSDGVQAAELIGTTIILSFNAREEGTGRFHPALVELRTDGTGQLLNSDNVPDSNDPEGIPFGSEYITDLAFDSGNLTLFVADDTVQPDPGGVDSSDGEDMQPIVDELSSPATPSGGSSSGATGIVVLLMLAMSFYRRKVSLFAKVIENNRKRK